MIELPELTDEPPAVTSLYPDPSYFKPYNEVISNKEDEVSETVDDAEVVGITHTDADGYGCEVMLREAYPDKCVRVVTASEAGPVTVDTVGAFVADYAPEDARVFIMDLSPNPGDGHEFISPFFDFEYVHVVDHHDSWTEHMTDVIGTTASLHIQTDKCATQIVRDLLLDDPADQLDDFGELTADRDLWIRDRPDEADALADIAEEASRSEYVSLARAHGSDIVTSEKGTQLAESRQQTRVTKAELAVNRAECVEIPHDEPDASYTAAITYGQCDPSHTGEQLYTGTADLVVVIYPSGGLSFRSSEGSSLARHAAELFGGGGHDDAAGARIKDFVRNDVGYATHWATMGRAARKHVAATLRSTA